MKTLYATLLVLICFQTITFGQNYRISSTKPDPETGEYCFYINGENSSQFLNSMFEKYPTIKRKGYSHSFKDINVDGIAETLQFTAYEGIYHYSYSSGGCCSSISMSYFKFFSNKNNANQLISAMTQNDSFAVAIYVGKSQGKGGLTTKDEAEFFIEYLKTIIGPPAAL